MTETRIKFNNIVKNQFPSYVREEFPLVVNFIEQYYLSQEVKGASIDLIENIDQYIKLDNQANQVEYATLSENISFSDETIILSFQNLSNGTYGFPDSYGLIQIDDEIITYTRKTDSSFTGCIRGFSGITSLEKQNHPDELVFSTSESADHKKGSKVINLSCLFLKEFLIKSKYQLTPGFENRSFSSALNQSLFIKQIKDFYRSKGTDESFRILFNSLYGEDVQVIKPKDYLFRPSDSQYQVTKDLVVESISGDPLKLTNLTLNQDEYGSITKASAPITKVEKIVSDVGNTYYKLSLDANYNRDISVDGAISGEFSIHPKTKLIGKVSIETASTNQPATIAALDVDSTIGFPKSGELVVKYEDSTSGIISYKSKTVNQFIECSNITNTILDASNIGINTYAYATINSGTETEIIKVRIGSVLENLDIVDDTYYFSKANTSSIKSLGVIPKDILSNNWFFNLATSYEVKSFKLSDISDYTYTITTLNDNIFKIGDNLKIIGQSGIEKESLVISIDSANSFKIKGQGELLESKYTVKRNLLKVNSKYSDLSSINSNVQNVYKIKDRTLVASPSIPYYNEQKLEVFDKSIIFSGTFIGDEFTITPSSDHGLYTGDCIYYEPEKIINTSSDSDGTSSSKSIVVSSLFSEGIYFVKRINKFKVKFARSRSDIYNSKFISLDTLTEINNNKIEFYNFFTKSLQSQKLLREISQPINDGKSYLTEPGSTGILINGVEILNYKSKDLVYYGQIESIEVLSAGSEYDVINPPTLTIGDGVGTGATGHCSVKGSLKEIKIINWGFDYIETPIIKITGGNGIGAKAKANMNLIPYQATFNSDASANLIGIGSAISTIGFTTYHKFRNSERIIYRTNSQRGVGGLSTNSSYYVSVQSPTAIKLHKTESDAISGINTISLTSFGIGYHDIESYNKKSVIKSINILDTGSGYENKLRTSSITGINTSISTVNINDHQYKSGEIVKYTNNGTAIGGLSSNTNYYLTKVSDSSFKLSEVGFGADDLDFYYKTKQYINFTSVGSGTHTFNYPEISVELIGNIGISSVNGETFGAVVQPIFRGEITSVHLSNKGVGYGSSEILNYQRNPLITLNAGTSAQLTPIISEGKVVEVLVNASGMNYNSPPTLNVIGSGFGAVITPIIENGQIIAVQVIESGAGYFQESTTISIISAGSGAELKAKIKTWNVNLYQKYFNTITPDDGFFNVGLDQDYGLQYCHLYAPRKLREIVYSSDQGGKILYGKTDLKKINNIESLSTDHSPIIGWAYDGNPIYGPYGYATNQGGAVVQMKSGYKLNQNIDRPLFPEGFFIEDYTYFETSDDSYLDENNGRFCKTPEFPNGTYAYFATINNLTADSSGPFTGYKHPIFPYLIGNNFKSKPNEFNFKSSSNQDEIDLNKTNWSRNTQPYNSINNYSYLTIPNKLNQTVDVKFAESGSVDNIGIVTGGNNYKINDALVFDEEDTGGYGLSARVSRIRGKEVNSISVASTTLSGLEFYPSDQKGFFKVVSTNPHNFKDKDLVTISGLNTTSSLIEGSYNIGVSTGIFAISGIGSAIGIESSSVTGIVTYIPISGNISQIRENDTLNIDSEIVKVLNVDPHSSRIRVLRSINGTVGSAHTDTSIIYQNPRQLTVDVGFNTSYNYRINKEIYFNPVESVGLGTRFGVGVGTTIFFSNPGAGITQIFIPTKTIYIPNHNLETGDQLTYHPNNGSSISVSRNGISTNLTLTDQSVVYVAKISNDLIGISSVKVGLGSTGTIVGVASTTSNETTLYFTGIGTGSYHSFKTNYSVIVGQISKNTVTVSTAQTHGLQNNDSVFIDVNPSISTSLAIKYNDYNRKLVANPKDFSASGINTETSTISISNHNFISGQQVIYTSSTPSEGLENNKVYYAIIVDENSIKLSNTYHNAIDLKPTIVGISSASDGTISAVNPPIEVYHNSIVTFDLSDSSLSYGNASSRYPAFKLNFYKDSNFTELFNSTEKTGNFEVERYGIVGITTNAKVILTVNEHLPEKIYYNLVPIYENSLPIEKEQISVDSTVFSNNQIQVKFSNYNGKQNITVASTSSFTYNLSQYPEALSYTSSTGSSLAYETDSSSAYGAISKVQITSNGNNYYDLPTVSSVTSDYGSGSILESYSTSIGKIKRTKINDIGFDFPTDFTLKPNVKLTQIAQVAPLASFQSIGITSFGRGYTSPAKLLVFDGKTNQLVPEVDLKYNLGDSQVTILRNSYGLNNTKPKILPTQNSNGVGIASVNYNSFSKIVTITLAVGFSTANSFPFAVNDKILIENVSVGIASDAKGYNSENYDYQLFTINSVTENIGGIGHITYSLDRLLNASEYPGTFDDINSSGRIIPEKYFPIFDPILQKNEFLQGEVVSTSSATGTVEQWNSKTTYLKIKSNQDFEIDQRIQGSSSKAQGIITSNNNIDAFFNLNSSSKVENGWQSNAGVLNDNLQRVQDSFYYQNFSYSLKSKVDYDTWKDAVGTLNHTLGFKKFSDYELNSSLYYNKSFIEPNSNKNSLTPSLTSNISSIDITNNIIGFANLNCVYDFDLVKENSLVIGDGSFSDEIIFSNKILTDYFESVGNRVLTIDDISRSFNSNPRSTRFSEVHRFLLSDARSQKYITYVRDKRFTQDRQFMIVTMLHSETNSYLNQYARNETTTDLGSFDFIVDGTEGVLLFYPTKYSVNDYDITTLSYNLKDSLLGVSSTSFGGIVEIWTNSASAGVSLGSTTIIDIENKYTSLKLLAEISGDNYQYEYRELSILHNGTDVELLEYGQLQNHSSDELSGSGLGTFFPYLTGSRLKIDFFANVGLGVTINSIQVAFTDPTYSGIGTYDMKHARLEARSVSIASTSSPISTAIGEYQDEYDGAYFIVQAYDITNNNNQLSEIVVVDDEVETYSTEFSNIETFAAIGTVGTQKNGTTTQLTFTPLPNIDVQVKVFVNALRYEDDAKDVVNFINASVETGYATYEGTERDIRRSFDLYHENNPIFQKVFDASNPLIVDIELDTIQIPNHFFVSGELLNYSNAGAGTSQSIEISPTNFVGIGTTDKLPSNVYVVKINDNNIKLSASAEDALKFSPSTLDLTGVGIGSYHTFTGNNQNAKLLVAIDNLIQSPIVSTAVTTTLAINAFTTDDILYFTGITSFFGGDLIKVGNEIMRIDGIGIGSTNAIRVRRPWLGTVIAGYSTGELVTKIVGNYNIVDNTLNFVEAPYGNLPYGTTTNPPDERDWLGITTSSRFQGRSFLRSGEVNTTNETYYKNYSFDDISSEFTGSQKSFELRSNRSSISGISDQNGIILINDIFQGPGLTYDYNLSENVGMTSITFTGTATSIANDVNTASIPAGGVIVSVGSTEGFGYQPLVSAGGTAVVSIAGTISSISIGNSGSGYRSGVQVVRVGVGTSSTGTPNIQFIGTASISNGHIIGVAITNPGVGYTISNPPYVIIDDPLSYSNIPLIYSSNYSGIGTEATIDVVVGQGSNVIDFEIRNTGYSYGQGDILTIPIGGTVGIPTVAGSSFNEFQISIQKTFTDKFSGWSIGELQVLDSFSHLFNGERVVFPIKYLGDTISIRSARGSNIKVQDTLLVFINDILQIPGQSYLFPGGSMITFVEAPKSGDTLKILFYKGSGEIDVIFRNILETVKIGDELTISYDPSIGQGSYLQEDGRTVTSVDSTDLVSTNPYFGPGNTTNETLVRPVVWCRQTEDMIINEQEVGKDRMRYEPIIDPVAYLIQSVGIGSTIVYVDNVRPFFNPVNENNISVTFQKNVTFISQDPIVSASATAIVSSAGTISSLIISDGGYGYTSDPIVTIQSPIGFGSTATATSATVSGIVSSFVITGPGTGYTSTNPPSVLIEPPTFKSETSFVNSYQGDSGVIVGFGITTISSVTKLIFDTFIPNDSYLQQPAIVGTAITISGLSASQYFMVYDSNVGLATTSIVSTRADGSSIGIGTYFVDNVYQVDSSEIIGINVTGIGFTYVKRLFARVTGVSTISFGPAYSGIISTSNYFGNFSWGKIVLSGPVGFNSYSFYGDQGIGGICTSSIVKRTVPLKYKNYIT